MRVWVVQVSYKELLGYFERKLNCQHRHGKSGTLGRGKTLNKFESVYISVQEALSSTGATLDVSEADWKRTITINTGDILDSDVNLEDDDRAYLLQVRVHSVHALLYSHAQLFVHTERVQRYALL